MFVFCQISFFHGFPELWGIGALDGGGGLYEIPDYTLINGLCVLSGLAKKPTTWNAHITTLPAECRPSSWLAAPEP